MSFPERRRSKYAQPLNMFSSQKPKLGSLSAHRLTVTITTPALLTVLIPLMVLLTTCTLSSAAQVMTHPSLINISHSSVRHGISDGKSVLMPTGTLNDLLSKNPAIVGGDPANENVVRHICYLIIRTTSNTNTQCTGTMLSADRILTAAHCFFNFATATFNAAEVYVVVAQLKRRLGPVYVGRYIDILNSYIPTTLQNDLAVISLNGVIRESFRSVALPRSRERTPRNGTATTAGYGRVRNDARLSRVLRSVALRLQTVRQCRVRFARETWPTLRRREVLCVKDPDPSGSGTKAICDGDSGGPLFYERDNRRILQIGIASFSENVCSSQGATSWFTNLKSYSSLVKQHLDSNFTAWDRRLEYAL